MDLQQLSASYAVRRLTEADIPAILALQTGNPQFFRYHPPLPSEASIREDLSALPPEKTAADKYYAAFSPASSSSPCWISFLAIRTHRRPFSAFS